MSCNETLAIILIYLMTVPPPLFMDRKCQFMVYGTSVQAPNGINLFSRFADRLNATSNYAKSEYDVRTSETLNSIYDLAGKILSEELRQEQERTAMEFQNGNYTDKLGNGADPLSSGCVVPAAVASSTIANTVDYAAAAAAKKNELELINALVVVSNAGHSGHRQARKTQKGNRSFHPRPLDERKKTCPRTTIEKRVSSRPSMPLLSMSIPVGRENGERWQPSSISTQSQERQYVKMEQEAPNWQRKGSRANLETGSSRKMNGLAESTADGDGGGSEVDDDDYSSNRHWSSSAKWRRKLQIDGRKNNLPNCTSRAIFFEEQLNKLIKPGEDVNEEDVSEKRGMSYVDSRKDYESHVSGRSVDSFPEVFSRPMVDSNSMPIIGSGNGLNEAIKHANSLLSSVGSVAADGSNNPAKIDTEDSNHRIGKQIQGFGAVPFEGSIIGANSGGYASTANLTDVMEKVLNELESLKECKSTEDMQPEGSPCDVVGSWNSETIGLQFHISMANPSPSTRTFVEGKRIEIELTERVPPRQHNLMDCDWFLTGSTTKQVGGPFYMTAQKTDKYFVATFAGLCKTCGGIPTIFGSWTFVYPAKDCQDISIAVENKRDVLRKDSLEAKRKHRRNRLNSKDKEKCSKCSL